MFTHFPTREGSVVSISIYGQYGEKFARRLAEQGVENGERLGAQLDVTDVGDRQVFQFRVEPIVVAAAPARAVRTRTSRSFRLFPARAFAH